MSDLLPAALAYATRGWHVFPCRPRGKEPLTPNGFHDASTDLATIRDWWQRWPEANVAIVTGRRSGFWVLDVDDDEALAELLSRHGALPDTAESLTGGGGRHVLFAWPADGLTITNARGRLPDGLDVRGEGGYIVGPPSVHPSGRAYAWEVSSDPLDGAAIVPAPDWLLELIAGPRPRPQGGGPLPDTIPEGHRNTALTSLAGSMRRRGASEDAIYAALQAENLARCDPPLGHEEVRTIARSVARYEPATFQTTRDYAHAETLAVLFANRLRWAERWGRWMRWTGKVWEQAPEEWVVRAASEALRAEYARHIAAAGDKEELGHWSALAAQTCVYARVAGGLAFLKGWPGFLTRPAQWDGDRWVLNTQSGILDLRSLELRPHDPAALCTKITGAAYDPGAEGSTWMAHLQRVLPNDNVRRQVQRSLGVALVGTTVEEALDIWHGSGRNGKTTTARALMAALGDYARPAAPNLLIQSKYERHPTELADLCGARWVVSTESGDGRALAEDLVKKLTGGEPIKARHMREDFFSFERTFSIVLLTNHRPDIAGVDEGIWRRIRLIPWTEEIPESERRPQDEVLAELEAESAAILAWAVAGLADWQGARWWTAPEVQAATAAYREEQDRVGGFVADCCELGRHYAVPVGALYEAYSVWAARNGEQALGKAPFGKHLRKRGITQERVGHDGARQWAGIRLLTDADNVSSSPLTSRDFLGELENLSASVSSDDERDRAAWEAMDEHFRRAGGGSA